MPERVGGNERQQAVGDRNALSLSSRQKRCLKGPPVVVCFSAAGRRRPRPPCRSAGRVTVSQKFHSPSRAG